MDIFDKVFIVVSRDKKRVMKGLSKSERYLMDVYDDSKHVSTFTTESSAEAWLRGGRIHMCEGYEVSDLEVAEVTVTYRCNK